WLCYLLQIGTCLYYAMFLVPLLGLLAVVLGVRRRPPVKLYVAFAVGACLSGLVALAMVYPYFAARDSLFLERSHAFASSYDGKLAFFGNVHETNLTLTGMHHKSEQRGAHEEIAFPGVTVLAMLLSSLGVPLWKSLRPRSRKRVGDAALAGLLIVAFSVGAMLLSHSMLVGLVVFSLGAWRQRRTGRPFPFAGRRGLYLGLLVLSVALFLGLSPLVWEGEPVRG